jgi:hypothetical protein
MIRFTKVLAVAAAVLTLPSMASALGIEIVGVSGAGAGGVLFPGESVTFDLVMNNAEGYEIFGVGANVTGYDDIPDAEGIYNNGISLQGGTSVSQAFDFNIPTIGTVATISNVFGTAPVEQHTVNQLNPQAYRTVLFQGADTSSTFGDGAEDHGIGGTAIQAGDIHFQVTFVADQINTAAYPEGRGTTDNSVQYADLLFSIDAVTLGGVILPATSDSFSLTVIPEPGTALLMGLGLAGLATSRRR